MFSSKLTSTLLVSLVAPIIAMCAADDSLPPHRDGVVLLKFTNGTSASEQKTILNSLAGNVIREIGVNVNVVNVGRGRVSQVIQLGKKLPQLVYVEPDYYVAAVGDQDSTDDPLVSTSSAPALLPVRPGGSSASISPSAGATVKTASGLLALPNDSHITSQWALQNTGQTLNGVTGTAGADERAASAWSVATGTNSVVVAVLDTGVQYSHPDLVSNMWNNPGGIGGCAAGTHGYNILAATCDPMDDEINYGGHGTHVAGILGAVGNNAAGVAGVNWTTSIMAVKWVNSSDSGLTSDLISAMDWVIHAKQAGVNVRVVNDSQTWAGTAFSQSLSDEIDLLTANDILFVTAAGNTAQDNDTTPRYPCSYNRPGEICVTASDQHDNLWTSTSTVGANYGTTTVQLAAPGVNIYSTKRLSNYGFITGGSMASPQVAGTAALILSQGYQSVSNLRATILAGVDVLPSLTSYVATGGRLNVCKAVPGCSTASTGIPANTAAPVVTGIPQYGGVMGASTGSWTGAPTAYSYQWYRCSSGSTCASILGATSETYAVLSPGDVGSTLAVTIKASNSSGITSVQSSQSGIVSTASSPFTLNSTITDGQTISGSVLWQSSPAQAVNFVQFYIDGVLCQTIASSPYEYNQSTTGLFDSTLLANGTHALGLRALANDNRTYAFYGAAVTISNPPRNTVLPVITGTAVQGQILSVSKGSWTNSPTMYTYRWNRCDTTGASCAAISGATANTYVVAAADVGSTLRASVTATNPVGSTTAQSAQTAVVTTGSLTITTTSLPKGTQKAAYSATLAASGGVTPYTWSVVSGSLPTGLSLTASTGVISGTPTATGTSNFTVQVKDNKAQTASRALSITINTAAAIALAQSNAVQGSSVGSIAAAFPGSNTAGNLILAFVRMSSSTQTVTVTDSAGNAYTDAVSQVQTADGSQVHLFYAKNIIGGTNTITATFSASNNHPWLAIYEYSGLSKTAPLDQKAAAQGNSVAPNTGSTPTTTAANELLFVGMGLPASFTGTVTAGASYTQALKDSSTSPASNETAVVTATGAYTGTFTLSAAANWSAVIATFKP
jgi:subtilisin family serine protease